MAADLDAVVEIGDHVDDIEPANAETGRKIPVSKRVERPIGCAAKRPSMVAVIDCAPADVTGAPSARMIMTTAG